MEFANVTEFNFDPLPQAFAADAQGADAYTTPAEMRPKLGDLARLSYIGAEVSGRLHLSAGDGAAEFTVRLTDGTSTLHSETITADGSQSYVFEARDINLAAVDGAARLRWVVDVDTAAGAGVTAQLAAALRVTHPVVIGTC